MEVMDEMAWGERALLAGRSAHKFIWKEIECYEERIFGENSA